MDGKKLEYEKESFWEFMTCGTETQKKRGGERVKPFITDKTLILRGKKRQNRGQYSGNEY